MTKCITLSDEAYHDLKTLKDEAESFSDIVRKLAAREKKEGLLGLSGVWKNKPDSVKAAETIYRGRKNIRLRV